jgi:hypothetical protein
VALISSVANDAFATRVMLTRRIIMEHRATVSMFVLCIGG